MSLVNKIVSRLKVFNEIRIINKARTLNQFQDLDASPFFILSSGRSGSTLLRRILEAHSDIHIPPESDYFIPQTASEFVRNNIENWRSVVTMILETVDSSPCFQYWGIKIEDFRRHFLEMPFHELTYGKIISEVYTFHLKLFKPAATVWGDKTPCLASKLNWLPIIYPKAKFIFMVRDGRAVVNSMMKHFNYPLRKAAIRWKDSVIQMQKFGKTFNNPVHYIKYENLIENPNDSISSVCQFLEVNFDPEMIFRKVNNLGDDVLSHHGNIHKPITQGFNDAWKLEQEEYDIAATNKIIKKELRILGY
jgi:hypothetical protein